MDSEYRNKDFCKKDKEDNEQIGASVREEKILAQITQLMYSYNLTVNVESGEYTLITGTGMERTVDEYKKHNTIEEIKNFQESIIHPAYGKRFQELMDFESAAGQDAENGFRGSLEYPVLYPGDSEYEWHEINVFIDTAVNGKKIANVLGRDITEAHNVQEKNEKELRAAADKNQILSELTRMLYSYNLTLNLRTGKYSMIIGTGMTQFMEIFKSTDDYETAYKKKILLLNPDYVAPFSALASLESLRARTNANGFIGSLEYGAMTDYGEEWHEINVFISSDETGEAIANILGRDITEVHRRQEQRENQQKAAMARDQLLSGVTKMLYSYNLTVNLETWKYTLITGTGMSEVLESMQMGDDYVLLSARLLHNIAPEDREKLNRLIGIQALKENINMSGFSGTVSCKYSGKTKDEWHEVNLFLGSNEDGVRIANILGRDITETHFQQEIKERELRASTARDQLLSGITKMLYSYNMTVNVNTGRYTLITGTGLESTVAKMETTDSYQDILDVFADRVEKTYIGKALDILKLDSFRNIGERTGHLWTEEFPMKYDDRVEWHEINAFAGYDEDGEPIVNILGRDVTEAHDKADTKAQLEIANASSAAKSAFLFNMSHDIRTPMNAIIGFTELLEKHLDDKKLARDYINKIKASNDFLLSLINNVLEMARIESGKTTIDETCWNAEAFADTLYSLFDSQMKAKGIEFTKTVDVVHRDVICDETKLREIFLNILSNALKYTPSGGKVTISLTEVDSDNPEYAMYRTSIEDTGIGMAEDFIPQMFEEFSRERSSTESKVNGTGLGMAIVKRLVDLMGGTIDVESRIGKGSRFTVTIPLRIAEETEIRILSDSSEDIRYDDFKGRRILLAEDNDLNAEIAATILKEAGFEVDRAEDGIICVDMLEKAEPGYYELILMDIQMPNMSGYKATQTIRKFDDKVKSAVPIVAMTANAFDEDRKNAIEAGMNGHIAKPINVDRLFALLSGMLAGNERNESNKMIE